MLTATWDSDDDMFVVEKKAQHTFERAGEDNLPLNAVEETTHRWCVGCRISNGVTHFMADDAAFADHEKAHEDYAKAAA